MTVSTGSSWDRVNFLHSSAYSTTFWIPDENSVDNIGML